MSNRCKKKNTQLIYIICNHLWMILNLYLDIDECELEPCDLRSSTCRNLNGSYACDCKPGYVKAANGACLGDDLCLKIVI